LLILNKLAAPGQCHLARAIEQCGDLSRRIGWNVRAALSFWRRSRALWKKPRADAA
jgi:hypothetical protein